LTIPGENDSSIIVKIVKDGHTGLVKYIVNTVEQNFTKIIKYPNGSMNNANLIDIANEAGRTGIVKFLTAKFGDMLADEASQEVNIIVPTDDTNASEEDCKNSESSDESDVLFKFAKIALKPLAEIGSTVLKNMSTNLTPTDDSNLSDQNMTGSSESYDDEDY
jgi:hypothetical protein